MGSKFQIHLLQFVGVGILAYYCIFFCGVCNEFAGRILLFFDCKKANGHVYIVMM
jgi:hypothetical protein